jgi:MarR family 2-MHQ and catechol resistance regulon transcriptional repressor
MKYANTHLYRKERLSVIKVIVLRVLAANGGAMTPSEIAEWTFRERHNITTLIDRMKRDGLVRVERNIKDKRFVNVSLTAKGRKVLKQAMPVAREIVNQVMLSISEGDAVPLENSLRVLRQNAHDGLEHLAKCAQHSSR